MNSQASNANRRILLIHAVITGMSPGLYNTALEGALKKSPIPVVPNRAMFIDFLADSARFENAEKTLGHVESTYGLLWSLWSSTARDAAAKLMRDAESTLAPQPNYQTGASAAWNFSLNKLSTHAKIFSVIGILGVVLIAGATSCLLRKE